MVTKLISPTPASFMASTSPESRFRRSERSSSDSGSMERKVAIMSMKISIHPSGLNAGVAKSRREISARLKKKAESPDKSSDCPPSTGKSTGITPAVSRGPVQSMHMEAKSLSRPNIQLFCLALQEPATDPMPRLMPLFFTHFLRMTRPSWSMS